MNAIVQRQSGSEIMETVLLKGDLSKLSPQERHSFYMATCQSLGLNALTRPFEYITLSGKMVLYARKDATDQLRSIHKVSVEDLAESEREGVFIVTAKVKNADGRTDISKGAVNIAGLKGEALANAIMKAETKAKRRATLSICGLGMLDETEIEDSANAAPIQARPRVPSPNDEPEDTKDTIRSRFMAQCRDKIAAFTTDAAVKEWWSSDELGKAIELADIPQTDIDELQALAVAKRKAFAATQKPADAPKPSPVVPSPDEPETASTVTAGDPDLPEWPDPETNYPEFVEALRKHILSMRGDPVKANDFWIETIDTLPRGTLFPPDLEMLRKELARLRMR